jgi:signal transduction histidine kinase
MLRHLRTLPLTVRTPLIVAALMVVVGTIASERVLSKLAETQQRQLRELATLYLDGLSVAVLPAAIRQDVWEAFDALDRATRRDHGLRALVTTVVSEDGQVLASSDPERFPTGAMADAGLAEAPAVDALVLTGSAPSVQVQAPLIHAGQAVGQLHAELDVSDLLAERRAVIVYLILGNGVATLVLAVAGYLVVRRMLRPIGVLAEHMSTDPGRGPAPIPADRFPRGVNEFAQLFEKYNQLVRAERERKEAAQRLADQERLVSLGRLASSVAHEINNPLGGLLNALDTLKRHGDRPGVAERSIALLERGLLGIRDVVRAMLETYRAEHGDHPLTHADLDDLRLLVGPEIQRRRQTLNWSVDLGGDRIEALKSGPVRQICLNLLLNASAAAGPGGQVTFAATAGIGRLRLTVEDTGPGLPPEAVAGLKGCPGATLGGLGLRVVSERVAALCGSVEVRRLADGLSSVEVVLPVTARDEEAA